MFRRLGIVSPFSHNEIVRVDTYRYELRDFLSILFWHLKRLILFPINSLDKICSFMMMSAYSTARFYQFYELEKMNHRFKFPG